MRVPTKRRTKKKHQFSVYRTNNEFINFVVTITRNTWRVKGPRFTVHGCFTRKSTHNLEHCQITVNPDDRLPLELHCGPKQDNMAIVWFQNNGDFEASYGSTSNVTVARIG